MEYHRDFVGERSYASRNHNQLKHTYDAPGGCRANLDWNLTLRQVRKKAKIMGASSSAPALLTQDLAETRRRVPGAAEHPDGPYHSSPTGSVGRYQNFANTGHMVTNVSRVSSGGAHGIDWQLNLRDGLHQNEHSSPGWRKHFARPQQSFDMMKENCAADNDAYQKSHITPQDRRIDRNATSIVIATIRDDPMSFRRWAGCEGTHVGQWRHLIEDTSRGRKSKRHLQHETTYREVPGDTNGSRITDNRSDGCIVEMMGKKRWSAATHHDPLAAKLPHGDPKLYHLTNLRVLPEQDETNRATRKSRQPRTDADISEFDSTPKLGQKDV